MIRLYSVFLFIVLFRCEVIAGLSFASGEIRYKLSGHISEYPFSFEFYNESNATVKIIDIVSSCDCVKIESDKKTYQPNEKGKIITDENKGSKHRLRLSIYIAPPAVVLPKLLRWKHADDSAKELSVKILDNFKFSIIEYDDNFFLVKTFIKEQNKVKIKPIGTLPKGKYSVKLYFINNSNDAELSTAAHLIFK